MAGDNLERVINRALMNRMRTNYLLKQKRGRGILGSIVKGLKRGAIKGMKKKAKKVLTSKAKKLLTSKAVKKVLGSKAKKVLTSKAGKKVLGPRPKKKVIRSAKKPVIKPVTKPASVKTKLVKKLKTKFQNLMKTKKGKSSVFSEFKKSLGKQVKSRGKQFYRALKRKGKTFLSKKIKEAGDTMLGQTTGEGSLDSPASLGEIPSIQTSQTTIPRRRRLHTARLQDYGQRYRYRHVI